MSREWVELRIATYNIHRARGLDRRTKPARIAAVLADIAPDIAALQEVIGPGLEGIGHLEEIGAELGMGWVMAPARELRGHQFGNAVLSRFPIREHAQHELSWKTCEPRCGQRVAVDVGGRNLLQIYNVHLGTALLERRYQAPRLAGWIHDRRVSTPKLVVGDFNEWARRGVVAEILERKLQSVDLYGHLRRRTTYPGFFPLVHLDHIYYEGDIAVRKVSLPRTRLALVASDHLPLVADIRVRF